MTFTHRFLTGVFPMIGSTKQAASAKTSLIYLTLGALTMVWTSIYYIYLNRSGTSDDSSMYLICYGFFFSGVVLFGIGLTVGYIGRAAMKSETAPTPVSITPMGTVPAGQAPAAPAAPAPQNAPAPVPQNVPPAPAGLAPPQNGFTAPASRQAPGTVTVAS